MCYQATSCQIKRGNSNLGDTKQQGHQAHIYTHRDTHTHTHTHTHTYSHTHMQMHRQYTHSSRSFLKILFTLLVFSFKDTTSLTTHPIFSYVSILIWPIHCHKCNQMEVLREILCSCYEGATFLEGDGSDVSFNIEFIYSM